MISRTAAAALAAAVWNAEPSSACTMLAIGKDATASGHPIVAHTDDSGADTTDVRFTRVPRRQWPAGSKRPLYNWADGFPRVVSSYLSPEYAPVGDQKESEPIGYIAQVAETYGYWDMDYGVQNEMGLSIGESTCTAKTVGWPASPDKPYGYCKAGIEDLSKLALERCATARCAVQTMGDIAVDVGFYSADSGAPEKPDFSDSAEALVVADPNEAWVFNVATGKNNASAIWAAMRVPDDHVAAIGNSFTIRKMNLNDPENYLYSPGVTEHAEEMGWWKPEMDEPGWFSFVRAYGFQPPDSDQQTKRLLSAYSGRRMWRIFSLLSPEEGAKLDPNTENLPNTKDPLPSTVPARKGSITAKMVMNLLGDHYEGTPYDLTAGMAAGPFGTPNRGPLAPRGITGIWERAISLHRSSWSLVIEAKGQRGVTWLGYDSPHGTAYLPFFGAATSAPESFRSTEGFQSKFSTKVAWWAFNMINQYTDLNFRLINKDVREKADKVEEEGFELVARCTAEADRVAGEAGEEAARELLTNCGNEFAEKKVAQWWEFGWSLFAKYGRYGITSNETAKGEVPQQYPDWWVKSVEVGYTLWTPQGPYHGEPDDVKTSFLALPAAGVSQPVALIGLLAVVASACYQVGAQRGRRSAAKRDDDYMAAP